MKDPDMKKFAIALAALFTLGAAEAVADVTKAVDGSITLKGRGRTRAIGFGSVTFTGRCAFTAWGVGSVTLPEGARYRGLRATSWKVSDGSTISGKGAIRVRLKAGMSATVDAKGGTASRSRLGAVYTAKFTGTGKVAFGPRMHVTEVGGSEIEPADVEGELPPDDVN
jgi:hypothetical protein